MEKLSPSLLFQNISRPTDDDMDLRLLVRSLASSQKYLNRCAVSRGGHIRPPGRVSFIWGSNDCKFACDAENWDSVEAELTLSISLRVALPLLASQGLYTDRSTCKSLTSHVHTNLGADADRWKGFPSHQAAAPRSWPFVERENAEPISAIVLIA